MKNTLVPTILTLLCLPALAKDLPSNVSEFRSACHKFMDNRTPGEMVAPEVGAAAYVPVENIVPGQPRFSFKRMLGHLNDLIDANGKDLTPYDNGRSAYQESDARGGIFYRGKVYVFDRHHHILANIYVGGKTMPVRIDGDWSNLAPDKFDARLLKEGLIYPFAADGSQVSIPALCELTEDPFLYLPELFILKVKTKLKNGQHKVKSTSGADPTILLKIDDGMPFLELEAVAPLLRENFPLPDLNKALPEKTLAEIANILKADARTSRLKEMVILAAPTLEADLDLQKIVDSYYSKPFSCRTIPLTQ